MSLGIWLAVGICCSAATSVQTRLTRQTARLVLGETLLFVKSDIRMKSEDRELQLDIRPQDFQMWLKLENTRLFIELYR